MNDDDYDHGDTNATACEACEIESIFALWAGAIHQYWLDLRYAYRQSGDPFGVRYDFERGGCRKLRRLIDPPGYELAIVRKAFIRRLVEGGLLTTDQAANLAD